MKPLSQASALLLKKIARTMNADVVFIVGVFADSLEESGHQAAKRVRKLWLNHQKREEYAATANFGHRSYWTRPRFIGSWRKSLRRKVGKIFGKKWRDRKPFEAYA